MLVPRFLSGWSDAAGAWEGGWWLQCYHWDNSPPGEGQRNTVWKQIVGGRVPNCPVVWDGGWVSHLRCCCPEKNWGESHEEMLPACGSPWTAPGASHELPWGRSRGDDHVQVHKPISNTFIDQQSPNHVQGQSNCHTSIQSNHWSPLTSWCLSGLISSCCRWGQSVEERLSVGCD